MCNPSTEEGETDKVQSLLANYSCSIDKFQNNEMIVSKGGLYIVPEDDT